MHLKTFKVNKVSIRQINNKNQSCMLEVMHALSELSEDRKIAIIDFEVDMLDDSIALVRLPICTVAVSRGLHA